LSKARAVDADRGKTDTALRELADAARLEGRRSASSVTNVSHVQCTSVVSSMVVFEGRAPAKHRIGGSGRRSSIATTTREHAQNAASSPVQRSAADR